MHLGDDGVIFCAHTQSDFFFLFFQHFQHDFSKCSLSTRAHSEHHKALGILNVMLLKATRSLLSFTGRPRACKKMRNKLSASFDGETNKLGKNVVFNRCRSLQVHQSESSSLSSGVQCLQPLQGPEPKSLLQQLSPDDGGLSLCPLL